MPLAPEISFRDSHYQGTVRLELAALQARAARAATATGLPTDPLTIMVAPELRSPGRPAFAPRVVLTPPPLR